MSFDNTSIPSFEPGAGEEMMFTQGGTGLFSEPQSESLLEIPGGGGGFGGGVGGVLNAPGSAPHAFAAPGSGPGIVTLAPLSEPGVGGLASVSLPTPPSSAPNASSVPVAPSSQAGPFVTPQVNQNDAALRSWRTSHNEELKLQAADALRRNDAELDQAKKDLDIMSAEWEARKKKRHEKNVAEEKKFVAERDADKGEGKIWNRVARFVDLKGLESTHGDKDTSRMREVITAQIK